MKRAGHKKLKMKQNDKDPSPDVIRPSCDYNFVWSQQNIAHTRRDEPILGQVMDKLSQNLELQKAISAVIENTAFLNFNGIHY